VKIALGTMLALVVGTLVGFFGVLVSVFSDSSGEEEALVTIGVVLVVYAFLGALWGFLLPQRRWVWGLFLGAPGAVALLGFMLAEGSPSRYLMLFTVLLLAAACGGAWGGSTLRGILPRAGGAA
jgi:peptidoglycan/LPS O-acetylase OafA/YrhL